MITLKFLYDVKFLYVVKFLYDVKFSYVVVMLRIISCNFSIIFRAIRRTILGLLMITNGSEKEDH